MLRQKELCALCGHRFAGHGELNAELEIRYAPTSDHVIPRCQGGLDELCNLRLVHAACNHARADGNGSKSESSMPRVLRVRRKPRQYSAQKGAERLKDTDGSQR
jgi:5-methylcytosine-specific restriction endonuclease McrA